MSSNSKTSSKIDYNKEIKELDRKIRVQNRRISAIERKIARLVAKMTVNGKYGRFEHQNARGSCQTRKSRRRRSRR